MKNERANLWGLYDAPSEAYEGTWIAVGHLRGDAYQVLNEGCTPYWE